MKGAPQQTKQVAVPAKIYEIAGAVAVKRRMLSASGKPRAAAVINDQLRKWADKEAVNLGLTEEILK